MTSANASYRLRPLAVGLGLTALALLALTFVACGARPAPRAVLPDPGKKGDGGRGSGAEPGDKDGPAQVTPGSDSARRYAVLVGLDGYGGGRDGSFTDLLFAEKDVEDLARLLIQGGYRQENVVVLTGKRGQAQRDRLPTVENIRRALQATTRKMTGQDVLVVALAGHGIEPSKGEHSYCAHGAKKLDAGRYSNLLSIQEVHDALGKAPGALKLLLVDACRNDPDAIGRGLPEVDDGFQSVTAPPTARNTVAFYSCSPGERSWEPTSLEHGLFMYHVIEGLREKANYHQDGRITWSNLVSYTDREVRSYSRNVLRRLQQPHFRGEARGEVPPLVLWESQAAPAPASQPAAATSHILLAEDFLRVKPPIKPAGWEGPDMRVATDKQRRHCLEPIGTEGIREVTLPKLKEPLSGDFFIEIEYVLDGYGQGETGREGSHELTVTLEGREGADRIRAEVDHYGRAVVGNTDRRRPENYKPHKLSRFRLEREGKVYRILLDDEFAAGGEQAFVGAFDTIKLGLTAGTPANYFTLRERARIYSVKIGRMRVVKEVKAAPIPLESGKPYHVDFRTGSLASLPPGWLGPDFYIATDKERRRCLEPRGQKEVKYLTMPRFSLKGDFVLEVDCLLDGWGRTETGKEGTHQMVVLLSAAGLRVPIAVGVDFLGRVSLMGSEPRIPLRYKPFGITRFRLEREGVVYRVSLNDTPVVGARIAYLGDFESIQIGLTSGIPNYHTLNHRARLYSFKMAQVPSAPRSLEGRLKAAEGGVNEDFRFWKVGELPADWEGSKANNIAIEPGVQKPGLELISKAALRDGVKMPALELRGKFIASFEAEVSHKDSAAILSLGGVKTQFEIAIRGDKKLIVQNVPPADIAKFWKEGQPQFVQVERTATHYRFKVNDQDAGSLPIQPISRGAFTTGVVTLAVKEAKNPTPRVTLVRIAPLN